MPLIDRLRLRAALLPRAWLRTALIADDWSRAACWVNARCGVSGYYHFVSPHPQASSPSVVSLKFSGDTCTVGLHPALCAAEAGGDQDRLLDTLVVLSGCRGLTGEVLLNLGDVGERPGLVFCESLPDYTLIPDPYYVNTTLNRALSRHYPERAVPWAQRERRVFWRGATTGPRRAADDWRSLDRVRLCAMAKNDPRCDIGITGIGPLSVDEQTAIRASGLMRPHLRQRHFDRYRYQLDIDGNTNSWGYFNKLLTGSPVLKVASPTGYRQWYYERLQPWTHYVPVAADLSDLGKRIDWLFAHDDEARAIGAAARAFAISMSLEREIARTRTIVADALANGAASA